MTVRDVAGDPRRSPPDERTVLTTASSCQNCGAEVSGPYCAQCGQKQTRADLSLRAFIEEATHDFSHWDSKLPRTLKALFLKPGRLTIDLLEGRRVRWVTPLRVYVICSLAYFLARPLEEVIQKRNTREVARITITNPDGSRTLDDATRREIAEGLPARIFGVERMQRAAANTAAFDQAFVTAFPKAMFVLVPLFGFFTSLAWRGKRLAYPAHLYTALHIHAAWFGALAVGALAVAFIPSDVAADVVEAAVIPYLLWYPFATLRHVFGESWLRTIAKTALVLGAYGVGLFVTSLAMLGYALMRM